VKKTLYPGKTKETSKTEKVPIPNTDILKILTRGESFAKCCGRVLRWPVL